MIRDFVDIELLFVYDVFHSDWVGNTKYFSRKDLNLIGRFFFFKRKIRVQFRVYLQVQNKQVIVVARSRKCRDWLTFLTSMQELTPHLNMKHTVQLISTKSECAFNKLSVIISFYSFFSCTKCIKMRIIIIKYTTGVSVPTYSINL